jgi:hypothetical protein
MDERVARTEVVKVVLTKKSSWTLYGLVTTDAAALSRLLDPEDVGNTLVINVINYLPIDKALTYRQTLIFDKGINRHKILQFVPTVL